MKIENLLFELADALRYPVLILALVALVVVLVEVGVLARELRRRRGRSIERLDDAVVWLRSAVASGDREAAERAVQSVSTSEPMAKALTAIVVEGGTTNRINKRLADFDYGSVKRLERTRILVRMGPALGLMGTLIPLSPALAGLADGDVETLTENLRVAFSVTVAGLFVGAVAFAITLVRDRIYDQDYSDVEYIVASLTDAIREGQPAAAESRPGMHVVEDVRS